MNNKIATEKSTINDKEPILSLCSYMGTITPKNMTKSQKLIKGSSTAVNYRLCLRLRIRCFSIQIPYFENLYVMH